MAHVRLRGNLIQRWGGVLRQDFLGQCIDSLQLLPAGNLRDAEVLDTYSVPGSLSECSGMSVGEVAAAV